MLAQRRPASAIHGVPSTAAEQSSSLLTRFASVDNDMSSQELILTEHQGDTVTWSKDPEPGTGSSCHYFTGWPRTLPLEQLL